MKPLNSHCFFSSSYDVSPNVELSIQPFVFGASRGGDRRDFFLSDSVAKGICGAEFNSKVDELEILGVFESNRSSIAWEVISLASITT